MLKPLVLAAALVFSAGAALAQDKPAAETAKAEEKATLTIGDKAPPIKVEKWLKGDAIKSFESGKVYIVEYWATWCPPCKASIPHLTELQKKHKDKKLEVVGVSVWEDARGEEYDDALLKKVQSFVDEMGDKMVYHVAYDGAAKKMTESYLTPAGVGGIPTSFIVDQTGHIAFIGHPMQMDKVLAEVLENKHDLAKLKAARENEERMQEEMTKLIGTLRKNDTDAFYTQADALIAGAAKDDPAALNWIAWTIVDPKNTRLKDKRADVALKAAMRADTLSEGKDPQVLDTLARAYFVKGDKAKAIETQEKAVKIAKESSDESIKEAVGELEASLAEYKGAK